MMNVPQTVVQPEIGRIPLARDPEALEREIRRFVPCQADILDSLLEAMIFMDSDCAPVLDLGCRTGLLSSRLMEEKPYLKLTSVDQDPAMIRAARERIGQASEWVDFECRSISRYARAAAYDYVLSNMALHFLKSPEEMDAVCRNVFWSLRPGGIFAFSVMLEETTPESGVLTWKQWERQVMGMGAARRDVQEWFLFSRPAYRTVPRESWLTWLRRAGFAHCDLVWSDSIFGTFWAKKPADKLPVGAPGLS